MYFLFRYLRRLWLERRTRIAAAQADGGARGVAGRVATRRSPRRHRDRPASRMTPARRRPRADRSHWSRTKSGSTSR